MSWIPYGSDVANDLLNKMAIGNKLVLIGELKGGCCACNSFFDILKHCFTIKENKIPQFFGTHDVMLFCIKKREL